MTNVEIAAALNQIADLLEFQGANPFRVRAYRNASRAIHDLPEAVAAIAVDAGRKLTDIPGVGKDLAAALHTMVTTGSLPLLDQLQAEVPQSVLALLRIPGLGPKKASQLFKELQIATLDQLRDACEASRVRELKGFGAKTEAAILAGLTSLAPMQQQRIYWAEADLIAQTLLEHLRGCRAIERMEMAGSYRRGKDIVGDLDVLAVSTAPGAVMDHFAAAPGVAEILARGDTKMSVRLGIGVQVDLRVVAAEAFGAALQYFTGSKEHNVALRGLAKDRGLKINEYGVFDGDKYVAGRTEAEVYATLDLPLFPPEIREARFEFDWAAAGDLPRLVELDDMRGDLHMHTLDTDGKNTLEEMVAAARARGLQYIAITDHSKRVSMANGLDGPRLRAQWAQIDRLNATLSNFRVLKGVEVDILERGGLDLPDDVLCEADWVVASIHYGQRQSRAEITQRAVDALANPHVSAMAHPTGRLINRRQGYEIDLNAVFQAAKQHGKMLELNSNPARLDLDDLACAAAKGHGIPIVVSTDAHSTETLAQMRYGILQARRAGLTPADVANTRPWEEVRKLLGRP